MIYVLLTVAAVINGMFGFWLGRRHELNKTYPATESDRGMIEQNARDVMDYCMEIRDDNLDDYDCKFPYFWNNITAAGQRIPCEGYSEDKPICEKCRLLNS